MTITKSKILYDYRDFVRDDKGKLAHKSKLLKNKTLKKYDFKRIKDRKSFVVGNFSIDLTRPIPLLHFVYDCN